MCVDGMHLIFKDYRQRNLLSFRRGFIHVYSINTEVCSAMVCRAVSTTRHAESVQVFRWEKRWTGPICNIAQAIISGRDAKKCTKARMCFWRSLCALHLFARQVRVTDGKTAQVFVVMFALTSSRRWTQNNTAQPKTDQWLSSVFSSFFIAFRRLTVV